MAGVPILREQLAKKMENSYGQRIDSETEITITAGATQALFTAIIAFVRTGEEVILIEPALILIDLQLSLQVVSPLFTN